MELSIGEMLLVAVAIVVLFGPDKLPQIARDLGMGIRKMKNAMDDVKTEILKETDHPVSEIKKEIDRIKDAAKEYNPLQKNEYNKDEFPEQPKLSQSENQDHEGPVSR